MASKSKLEEMIESVEGGVARGIDELVREYLDCELEDLTEEQLEEIDEAIFTCEMCGWTMPVEEQSEDDAALCRECQEDEE